MCIGHAMEERKRLEGQESEKPAPKKRGPKPKPKTEKGDTPPISLKREVEDTGHTLTLTLSKELQEKLLQYAVVKMLEEAAEAGCDSRL